jgi:hypothetical protein
MSDGSIKEAEDIRIGDQVMGPDSQPRTVIDAYEGKDQMFRIETPKGDQFTVSSGHILTLKGSYANSIKWSPSDRRYRVYWSDAGVRRSKSFTLSRYETQEAAQKAAQKFLTSLDQQKGDIIEISLAEYMKKSQSWKDQYRAFKIGVDFPYQKVDLDPYFLGLWLGDGTSCRPEITTNDQEVITWLDAHVRQYNMKLHRHGSKNQNYLIVKENSTSNWKYNPFTERLLQYDLIRNKHIPVEYLRNDRKTRLKVLAGLIDSDGFLDNNTYELVQKNDQLTKDIIYLCRSLGFAAYSRLSEKTCTNTDPPVSAWYNRIRIYGSGLHAVPLLLTRKKATVRKQIKDALVLGMKITSLGIGRYCGFTLDGDCRFVLGNFLVTHNSYRIMLIQKLAEKRSVHVAVTSTTGVSAINVAGVTIHSWSCIGYGRGSAKEIVQRMGREARAALYDRLHTHPIVVIDEVSMLHGTLLDKIDWVFRLVLKRHNQPFGGKQMIFSGDTLQLPPVEPDKDPDEPADYYFTSRVWKQLNQGMQKMRIINLNKPYRYTDMEWYERLGRIRVGQMIEEDHKFLEGRCMTVAEIKKENPLVMPPWLLPYRRQVQNYNAERMNEAKSVLTGYALEKRVEPKIADIVRKRLDSFAPRQIEFKVGANVMLTVNMMDDGFANGSQGVVREMGPDYVGVEFRAQPGRIMKICLWPHWMVVGKTWYMRFQIPLMLAWACTIHKVQGGNLEKGVIDLRRCFAPFQSYVALARVRSAEGIYLLGYNRTSIIVDEDALAYAKLIEKSR